MAALLVVSTVSILSSRVYSAEGNVHGELSDETRTGPWTRTFVG